MHSLVNVHVVNGQPLKFNVVNCQSPKYQCGQVNLNKILYQIAYWYWHHCYTLKICFSGSTILKIMNLEHTYYTLMA